MKKNLKIMIRKSSLWNKRAIAEAISVILLLLILVIVGFIVYNWTITYTNTQAAEYNIVQKSQIVIDVYDSNTLYVRSLSNFDLNFTKLEIEGVDCGISGIVKARNMTQISLNSCPIATMDAGLKEIILYSPSGVFSAMKQVD